MESRITLFLNLLLCTISVCVCVCVYVFLFCSFVLSKPVISFLPPQKMSARSVIRLLIVYGFCWGINMLCMLFTYHYRQWLAGLQALFMELSAPLVYRTSFVTQSQHVTVLNHSTPVMWCMMNEKRRRTGLDFIHQELIGLCVCDVIWHITPPPPPHTLKLHAPVNSSY